MGEMLDWISDQMRRTANAAEEAMDSKGNNLGIRVDGVLAGMTPKANRGVAARMGENAFTGVFGQSKFDDDYDGKL
jgi:hypothetical protein